MEVAFDIRAVESEAGRVARISFYVDWAVRNRDTAHLGAAPRAGVDDKRFRSGSALRDLIVSGSGALE